MDPNTVYLTNGGLEDHLRELRQDWKPVRRRRRRIRIPRVRRPLDDQIAD
jgi:hypothetical protein